MTEEFKFPIDRFRDVASLLSEMERRINVLEAEVKRLDGYTKYQNDRIKELETFRSGIRIVMNPPKPGQEVQP